MKVSANENSCVYGEPGIFRGYVRFDNPILSDYAWPLCEIRGKKPGAKLCIIAGIHVNEVSSIEAAIRLQSMFEPENMAGTVSIIPIVNRPAQYSYTEYVCPVDGKNILYTFPGKDNGTFSEALSYALVNEWSKDAACFLDLHGGDLRENCGRFVFFQLDHGSEMEQQARKLALCFDADVIYGLAEEYMQQPYMTPTGLGSIGRVGMTVENGANGVLSEDVISYHVGGVMNVARMLGILDSPISEFTKKRIICAGEYLRPACPEDGMFYSEVEPGDQVTKGQRIGTMRNLFGEPLGDILAPEAGVILWRMTHPLNLKGTWLYGLVMPEDGQRPKKKIDVSFAVHGMWNQQTE